MLERLIYKKIEKHLKRKEFTIITGARQSGKTTILKQLYLDLRKSTENVWLVTFERENVLRDINVDAENIFKYTRRPPNPLTETMEEPPFYILIDEVQYADNPTRFLKYLYDTFAPNLKIIATGSSSFYLDSKFKDSLVGRKKIFELNTLNFEEFLIFKEKAHLRSELLQIQRSKEYISLVERELLALLNEYFIYGGYPEVVLDQNVNDKVERLEEIKNSYIKRDIMESRIENEQKFYQLMVLLSGQIGNLLNKHELSKVLKLDIRTIDKYIFVLQKCFHISLISPFHRNLRKELLKMPKVFFGDLGLRNVLLNNFTDLAYRSDNGALLENYTFLRLKEKYNTSSIYFWRTADMNEVDFVVENKAYEVKFSIDSLRLAKYKKFIKTYPDIALRFVSFNYSGDDNTVSVLKL